MNPAQFLAQFGAIANAPDGIQRLREMILQLAVQGKLVAQEASDEPAAVLLEKIQAEKERLIREGTIKRQKPLPAMTEAEKPFALPEGWEWVRLGAIGYDWGQITPRSEFTYIDVSAINNQKGVIESPSVVEATNAPSRARKVVKLNTVIYSTIRPYLLNVCVVEKEYTPQAIASTAFAIIHPFSGILSSYIRTYLRSPVFIRYVESIQTGVAYPAINDRQFFSGLFPLAPEKEQTRIMQKVDSLLSLCDQLEALQTQRAQLQTTTNQALLEQLSNAQSPLDLQQAWQRLQTHLPKLFTQPEHIKGLRDAILQLAVQGKLVPQDANDEPAAVLLAKIKAEKERLVQAGKIKRQKPLPAIMEEEKPFALPKGWEWVRIGDIATSVDYGTSEKTMQSTKGVPVVAMGNIQNGRVVLINLKFVPENIYDLPALYLENRDLLYNRTNSLELVGKTGIFLGDSNHYTFASYLIRIRLDKDTSLPEFVNLNMITRLFRQTQIEPHLKQQCGQANVNGTIMKNMLVAIPPEKEIPRIIAKSNSLLSLCDQLESHLKSARHTQEQFARAAVALE